MRRLAAIASLALLAAATVLAIVTAIDHFPRCIVVLACIPGAVVLGWWGLVHASLARGIALAAAAALTIGAVALVALQGDTARNLTILVAALLCLALARVAFTVRPHLPTAPDPQRPVLIYNPRS